MKIRIAPLAIGLALITAACGDRTKKAPQADSSLARDLALAGNQTANPTFQDTAVAPAPAKAAAAPKKEAPAPVKTRTSPPRHHQPTQVAQAPAPAPQPPVVVPQPIAPAPAPVAAPITGEVAAGSAAGLTAGSKVCTSASQPGDKLVATLNAPLIGTNGKEIPAGSTVVLEVADAAAGASADSVKIAFRVRSIVVNDKTYTVDADAIPMSSLEKTKVSSGGSDGKKVAGGAIAGAILGQLIGHSTKGTLIGAAAGAAAGAAVARSGEKWDACLPQGGQLRLKLNSPLIIT
ncbi:MAG: YMGG-like glycine zipper-containing protein [Gemmatimonadaceae bacterium]